MAKLEELVAAAEDEWAKRWSEGPTRTRWTTLPVQVGDPAPDLELADEEGRVRRLSEFWSEGPALVIFWRHFGCGCGLDRAKRLVEEHPDYAVAGANVVVVGQGEPPRAAAYKAKYGLPTRVLCDPELRAYEAYGLLEGLPSQVLFDAPEDLQQRTEPATAAFVQARRGMQRPLVDNPWQLPGEFVVDPRGRVRLAWRYNHCEDFADPRALTMAIRGARRG